MQPITMIPRQRCDVFDGAKTKHPTIQGFSADVGYKGTSAKHVVQTIKLKIEILKKQRCMGYFGKTIGRDAHICLDF